MIKALLILVVSTPLAVSAGFVEEPQFGTYRTQSINWCDLDLDGDPDLAEATSDGQDDRLYINEGDGTFEEFALPMEGFSSYCMAWGDCENDLDPDLAVGCFYYPPTNFIYVNDGDGNLERRPELGTKDPNSLVYTDIDLDGDLDVAMARIYDDYQLFVYSNNGDGSFEETAQYAPGWARTLAWGDADGDGDPDLAVGLNAYPGEQNYLYVNNSDGTFTAEPRFGEGRTYSVAWGDFDNDGDLDIAVGNREGNYLYVNEGDLNFTAREEFGTLNRTFSLAWADYDNDGDLDLAVGNSDEPDELYVNNGDGTFTATEPFGTGEYSEYSIGWADSDLDGDLDLAVGYFGWDVQSYLYVNDENDEDYLSIYPVGRYGTAGPGYSNGSGIGAKVYAYEPGYLGSKQGLLGFREVGSGRSGGDDSINVEFGLPLNDTVDVRIVWPGSAGSHITQDLIVDKTQFITVHESIFHLLSPEDGSDAGGFPLVLNWEKAFSGGNDPYDANVENYTLEIATDEDFANVIYTADVTKNKAILDESCGLANGEMYYWRVFANYADTPGYYSQYSGEAWAFTLSTVGIALDYFDAASEDNGVELSWAANEAEETGIAGFNLYRSVKSDVTDSKAITSRDKLNAKLITGASPYEYVDTAVENGITYSYWLEAIDVGGSSETFGPVDCTWRGALPTTYALYQSRPNPASGNATIAFDLPETALVTLTVYDISGRKVTTVVNETLTAGNHERTVSGLAPGVYVYKLSAGSFNAAKKMVVQ
jgi:hypothetical protein